MADFEQRVKNVKVTHKNGEIEKAKAEERMKNLKEQKTKILDSCDALGVDPSALSSEIEKKVENLNKMITTAEEALGITETEESPF